jgi:4-hydroxy-2-oxoglutarate aldolase
VLGSNGEAASLEEDEKLALVGGPGPRRAAGSSSRGPVREHASTIAFTRKAADRGVDAALVLTPSYYKSRMTPEALQRHEAVAEASPIPVLIYSVPAFTTLLWPSALTPVLAKHPRIAGRRSRAAT